MPGFYSSQGTTITFNGQAIGFLTDFEVEAKAGNVREKTNVTSLVVGTGQNSRVVKQYDATAIEPPTISISFWGPPSFSAADAGLKAAIVFTAPGDVISGEAVLLSWRHSGRANQWSTGSAQFQLTGNFEE